MPQWDANFRENIANNIVPSGKIYSKSVPAGKMRIPTKIKSKSLSPTLLKKRLWHWCFPVNFVKFARTPLFTEHFRATASKEHT